MIPIYLLLVIEIASDTPGSITPKTEIELFFLRVFRTIAETVLQATITNFTSFFTKNSVISDECSLINSLLLFPYGTRAVSPK